MEEMITLDGNNIEIVERFSYFGDVLSSEGVVRDAVTSRIRSAWKNFKDVFSVSCKKTCH